MLPLAGEGKKSEWYVFMSQGPNLLSGTVGRQCLIRSVAMGEEDTPSTSPSDSVLCLMRIAHARFLSDTTRG